MLRAVADPVRLRVIELLKDGPERTCSWLAEEVDIPLPTMSHHLKTLREAGVTSSRKEGTTRWTGLRSEELEEQFPGFVNQLGQLARVEHMRHAQRQAR
ncbi:ArsR/SmtB family transcription factor [Paenarthrobacter sp. NPDC090520]